MTSANIKSVGRAVIQLFRVPSDNPDLMRAQFDAFLKQIPLLYFILISNTIAVAYTFVPLAPAWLTLIVPSVLSALAALRTFWWLRQRHLVRSDADILRNLRVTNWLVAPISLGFVTWSFLLYPYGDVFAKGQVAFYMAVTVIGCIFSLMHLRSAALISTLLVNIPYVVFFFLTGEPTLKAIAINTLLVSGAMVTVLFIYYRDFADLVASRKSLLVKQAETEALSDENFRLANLDPLTELPNRRRFFTDLARTFSDAKREGNRLAVGIIDLDGFKPVNDIYGHTVGDRILIDAAGRIREVCEGFGPQHVQYARLGGDEFGLLIVGNPTDDDLLELGQKIGDRIRLPYAVDPINTALSCSIGFAAFPQIASSAEALYECADYSLYHAKRHLRGQAVIFSKELEVEIRSRSVIEGLLRTCDFDVEMDLVFQPIVDAVSEHTVGFEALARWRNPALGWVSPADFVPAAERIGLIRPMTHALLKRALVAARNWPDALRLSFNLSAHDICAAEGILSLIAIVERSGFPASRIDFEITETAVTFDFVRAQQSIATLKAMGCGVSLDDFGTGYSSLSHVHKLPLNKIKIDRSFVADINENAASLKIIKSLTSLCDDMEIASVAEGVETYAQLETMRRLGCQFIQGYYFARPMPESAIADYLRTERQRNSCLVAPKAGA
ncbi:putative bifunctional diguanylate cyclase/phosphodiesterase [Rhodopseudomonas palustris]|uniref:EAL domain-containing protein n=1 Tax=Rhodopseudomonas palustris TaxID=1076 RepID=A0A418VE40_RHOPL|nr:EAL domain-containing protein [Rhodopseudomonas palustris]RJF74361.1 EAL domain-containing protein [Rhodopseudomonas palustris]